MEKRKTGGLTKITKKNSTEGVLASRGYLGEGPEI